MNYLTREVKDEEINQETFSALRSESLFGIPITDDEKEDFFNQWDTQVGANGERDKTTHLVASYPVGTSYQDAHAAGRDWAEELFGSGKYGDRYDYYTVFHDDRPHPHLHLVVNRRGLENGNLLKISKRGEIDYDELRYVQASTARRYGIELDTSPRFARGQNERGPTNEEIHRAVREKRNPVGRAFNEHGAFKFAQNTWLYSEQIRAEADALIDEAAANDVDIRAAAQSMRRIANKLYLGQPIVDLDDDFASLEQKQIDKMNAAIERKRNGVVDQVHAFQQSVGRLDPNSLQRIKLERIGADYSFDLSPFLNPISVDDSFVKTNIFPSVTGRYRGLEQDLFKADRFGQNIIEGGHAEIRNIAERYKLDPEKMVERYKSGRPVYDDLAAHWEKQEVAELVALGHTAAEANNAVSNAHKEIHAALDLRRESLLEYQKTKHIIYNDMYDVHHAGTNFDRHHDLAMNHRARIERLESLLSPADFAEFIDFNDPKNLVVRSFDSKPIFGNITQNAAEQKRIAQQYVDSLNFRNALVDASLTASQIITARQRSELPDCIERTVPQEQWYEIINSGVDESVGVPPLALITEDEGQQILIAGHYRSALAAKIYDDADGLWSLSPSDIVGNNPDQFWRNFLTNQVRIQRLESFLSAGQWQQARTNPANNNAGTITQCPDLRLISENESEQVTILHAYECAAKAQIIFDTINTHTDSLVDVAEHCESRIQKLEDFIPKQRLLGIVSGDEGIDITGERASIAELEDITADIESQRRIIDLYARSIDFKNRRDAICDQLRADQDDSQQDAWLEQLESAIAPEKLAAIAEHSLQKQVRPVAPIPELKHISDDPNVQNAIATKYANIIKDQVVYDSMVFENNFRDKPNGYDQIQDFADNYSQRIGRLEKIVPQDQLDYFLSIENPDLDDLVYRDRVNSILEPITADRNRQAFIVSAYKSAKKYKVNLSSGEDMGRSSNRQDANLPRDSSILTTKVEIINDAIRAEDNRKTTDFNLSADILANYEKRIERFELLVPAPQRSAVLEKLGSLDPADGVFQNIPELDAITKNNKRQQYIAAIYNGAVQQRALEDIVIDVGVDRNSDSDPDDLGWSGGYESDSGPGGGSGSDSDDDDDGDQPEGGAGAIVAGNSAPPSDKAGLLSSVAQFSDTNARSSTDTNVLGPAFASDRDEVELKSVFGSNWQEDETKLDEDSNADTNHANNVEAQDSQELSDETEDKDQPVLTGLISEQQKLAQQYKALVDNKVAAEKSVEDRVRANIDSIIIDDGAGDSGLESVASKLATRVAKSQSREELVRKLIDRNATAIREAQEAVRADLNAESNAINLDSDDDYRRLHDPAIDNADDNSENNVDDDSQSGSTGGQAIDTDNVPTRLDIENSNCDADSSADKTPQKSPDTADWGKIVEMLEETQSDSSTAQLVEAIAEIKEIEDSSAEEAPSNFGGASGMLENPISDRESLQKLMLELRTNLRELVEEEYNLIEYFENDHIDRGAFDDLNADGEIGQRPSIEKDEYGNRGQQPSEVDELADRLSEVHLLDHDGNNPLNPLFDLNEGGEINLEGVDDVERINPDLLAHVREIDELLDNAILEDLNPDGELDQPPSSGSDAYGNQLQQPTEVDVLADRLSEIHLLDHDGNDPLNPLLDLNENGEINSEDIDDVDRPSLELRVDRLIEATRVAAELADNENSSPPDSSYADDLESARESRDDRDRRDV